MPELTFENTKKITEFDLDGRKVVKWIFKGETKTCRNCLNFYEEQLGKVYTRCRLMPKKWMKGGGRACVSFKPGTDKSRIKNGRLSDA